MATEEQCEFFRKLYEDECAREKALKEQATRYLSLVTLYSAFVVFVTDKAPPDTRLLLVLYLLSLASMIGAFLCSLWVLQIATYEGVANPRKVATQMSENPPTNPQFFLSRIADYTVATERNTAVNNTKAECLTYAGFGLLIAITLQSLYFVLRVY